MWELAQQLSYQASHDALTGLINRREFDRQLEQALHDSQNTGREHTLCYMDLDQFKVVNDTCGHIAGDRLLKQLSQVLIADIRNNDVFARLGGDEFGLLLEGCGLEKAEQVVEKIRQQVKDFRFSWEDKTFELGVSIGMVPITKDSPSVTELLSESDAACYVAKELGRNRVHRYRHGDTDLVKHKNEMQWVHRIQNALEQGRFVTHFQEIVSTQSGQCRCSEILVRMLDEDGELVLPGAFIPAAERYHLMSNIDRWVIHDVFSRLSQLSNTDEMMFAINLSGQSIGDETLLKYVLENIKQYDIDPARICFEITETAAVANLDSARQFIGHLHDMGVKFALDDFGSGLSSFAYLKNLNVDYLKIDGSFVRDIALDPVDFAMVASINKIGHLMGIETIAEFVEDEDILECLRDIGVDFAQGYYIHRPCLFDSEEQARIQEV
jgi:diguanylate cyclase (GGDEF)-like protein